MLLLYFLGCQSQEGDWWGVRDQSGTTAANCQTQLSLALPGKWWPRCRVGHGCREPGQQVLGRGQVGVQAERLVTNILDSVDKKRERKTNTTWREVVCNCWLWPSGSKSVDAAWKHLKLVWRLKNWTACLSAVMAKVFTVYTFQRMQYTCVKENTLAKVKALIQLKKLKMLLRKHICYYIIVDIFNNGILYIFIFFVLKISSTVIPKLR